MSIIKDCRNCIWFDQCHEDDVCDDYEPLSFDEQEELDAVEYEQDLYMRHALYERQITEQDE